ncbi:MAG TPA: hypothetical protein VK324_00900 [Tepidisphaeraceae bacterium]|nr:hypothetical protein [Tepidisphaeraceae bacterium]
MPADTLAVVTDTRALPADMTATPAETLAGVTAGPHRTVACRFTTARA